MTVSAHALTRWMRRAPASYSPDVAEGALKARIAAAQPVTGQAVISLIGKGAYRTRRFKADADYLYCLSRDGKIVITVLERD